MLPCISLMRMGQLGMTLLPDACTADHAVTDCREFVKRYTLGHGTSASCCHSLHIHSQCMVRNFSTAMHASVVCAIDRKVQRTATKTPHHTTFVCRQSTAPAMQIAACCGLLALSACIVDTKECAASPQHLPPFAVLNVMCKRARARRCSAFQCFTVLAAC